MELKDFLYVGEYLEDRLYFATVPDGIEPQSSGKYYFFNIDNELVYENFYSDFGPLNLSMLYRYCEKVLKCLSTFKDKVIVHLTNLNGEKRANAAFLVASFAIIHLEKTVEEALAPLIGKHYPQFLPFRDAANAVPIFNITLKDCLQAIYRAQALGFFRFNDFNVVEYEYYEKVEAGDMNWIVPQKFLAFSGPTSHADSGNAQEHAPEYYFSYFKSNNITNVIRLNRKSYDATRFTNSGFRHNDLYFLDGSTPSDLILDKFFKITEGAKGAIAVHCKAGLGRTGSVIACYLMKHYRFNVGEAIAWVRICRPGSIIGIQQTWLHKTKPQLWLEGNRHRMKLYGNHNFIPTHRFGVYSNEMHCILNGPFENWQGEPLYEPSILKKNDVVSKIVRDIGAINLYDAEDVPCRLRASIRQSQTQKNTFHVGSGAVRMSRSRMNGTQGDRLFQEVSALKLKSPEKEVVIKKPRILIKRISCDPENETEREKPGLNNYNAQAGTRAGSRKQTRSLPTPLTPLGAAKARLIQRPPPKPVPVTRIYKIPIEVTPKSSYCLSSNQFRDTNCNMTSNRTVGHHHFLRSHTRRKENSNLSISK